MSFDVTGSDAGQRLDAFLAARLQQYSRVHLRRAIDAGAAIIDHRPAKASHRLREGEQIRFVVPQLPREGPQPEEIPLDVVYDDAHIAAVNKPPGMVVHPAKGHWKGTLASALAHHFSSLSTAGGATRPGIVHRLDRDTSGVILVAKTDAAHMSLAEQFERRTVEKEYRAIVVGSPPRDRDLIDRPIGAHPYQREKMAIRHDHPTVRQAQTFYEVVERFTGFSLVRILPKTGRTHQIRVHLASIGCPVLCDRLYGGRARITRGELTGDRDETIVLERQALHAHRLKITHPVTNEPLEVTAPLAADLQAVVQLLQQR
jgi:23S rRNA pseudouridine1911/1915/1917 synthase